MTDTEASATPLPAWCIPIRGSVIIPPPPQPWRLRWPVKEAPDPGTRIVVDRRGIVRHDAAVR